LTPATIEIANAAGVSRDKPLHFFLERFAGAYATEIDQFIGTVVERHPMPVTAEDGRRALVLAEAAVQSLGSGQAVRVAP
jgi:myo-inositol 2-dehydrogenase/D-chiro-inositol 1-dehydrogenase